MGQMNFVFVGAVLVELLFEGLDAPFSIAATLLEEACRLEFRPATGSVVFATPLKNPTRFILAKNPSIKMTDESIYELTPDCPVWM